MFFKVTISGPSLIQCFSYGLLIPENEYGPHAHILVTEKKIMKGLTYMQDIF